MTNTVLLPHETHGNPPLIMLHGLFGSGTNFRTVAKHLAENRTVHCLDLRNHGNAPWDDDHSFPALAADVLDWMDNQGLGQVDLLGHSMGGKTAMSVALTAPERIHKLVVVDIAPVTYAHTMAGYTEAMLAVDLKAAKSRRDVDRALAETIPESAIRAFLLQNLKRSDSGMSWRINLRALLHHTQDISSFPNFGNQVFSGPSLFLHGDRSDYVLPKYEPAVYARFTDAHLQEVSNCGHWVHAEQPKDFLGAVNKHLGTLNNELQHLRAEL